MGLCPNFSPGTYTLFDLQPEWKNWIDSHQVFQSWWKVFPHLTITTRYGMTVMSTITVYCIAWIVLGQSSEQSVGPQDMNKFRTIMFVVLAIGAVASIAFHLTVTEKESSVSGYEEIQGDADLVRPMGMKDWFKEPQFYQVALTRHSPDFSCMSSDFN